MKYCANDACPDLMRYGQRGEFLDRIEICPKCEESLTSGPAPQRITETRWADQVCVRSYRHVATAHVARAKLESVGIPATVLDQYTVGTDWLYSDAIGGVKVFVPAEHEVAAAETLASDDSELLETTPEAALRPSPAEVCPRCGTAAGVGSARSHRWRALSLLLTLPLVFWRRWLRCPACGHQWRPPKETAA